MAREVPMELCRSEIARVADALDVLVAQHGSRPLAAAATGISLHIFSRCLQRRAYERVAPTSLALLAKVHDITVKDLLGGKGPKPPKVTRHTCTSSHHWGPFRPVRSLPADLPAVICQNCAAFRRPDSYWDDEGSLPKNFRYPRGGPPQGAGFVILGPATGDLQRAQAALKGASE